MGSSSFRRRWLRGASASALLAGAGLANAQVPVDLAPAPDPVPAAQPTEPALPVASPPPRPPPLAPAPAPEPPKGPSFLKPPEQVERSSARLPRRLDAEPSRRAKTGQVPKDFVVSASPWVDLALTSFWMGERSDNFLNVSVQAGGYFLERLRISARLTAPLEEAVDDYDSYSFPSPAGGGDRQARARSISLLYGASFGLILSNSKTFLFAPGITAWRADVNAYGTTGALTLPFEWTTHRHLRVGFELALGHSFGGTVQRECAPASSPGFACRPAKLTRPGGTAVLLQYSMGWALSAL